MSSKALGCILMILGTTIGAGMLALPVVTAHESFSISLILLIISWTIMTIGAYSLLEVSSWLPLETNMISMAKKTLGPLGKWVTWVIYLLLFYALMCAYLSGISDIIQGLFAYLHVALPRALATFLALSLFVSIVYKGIGTVDLVNRAFMSIKLIAYLLVVLLMVPHIKVSYLMTGQYTVHNNTFMVMLTSFGYALIIPSLRGYLGNDKPLLKKVVLIGSLLPLFVYTFWILVVQGLIPRGGSEGLISILSASNANSLLMNSIGSKLHSVWFSSIVDLFISICAVTSFLGVSICLTDFIADGLKVKKQGKGALSVYSASFLPPLFIVLFCPGIFIQALSYAGILCLFLLIILPLMMLYFGRYHLNIKAEKMMPFGKRIIFSALLGGIVLLAVNVFEVWAT